MASTQGPIDQKTFVSKDAGKMQREREDAFIESTYLNSSGKETEHEQMLMEKYYVLNYRLFLSRKREDFHIFI